MTKQELIRQAKQIIRNVATGTGVNEVILDAKLTDVTWPYTDVIVAFKAKIQDHMTTVTVHTTPSGWRRADLYYGAEMIARFTLL